MATYAGRYSEDLQDRYGNGYRNALVAVQTLAAAPVTLYADRTKTAYVPASGLAANEIKADSRGNLIFFADPGNYQIVVTPVGGSTLAAFPVSVLPDPLEPDASEGALANEEAARIAGDDAIQDDLTAHEADTANPHAVTKAQVGLSDVDNTSDANKPVSTAQGAALDAFDVALDAEATARSDADDTLTTAVAGKLTAAYGALPGPEPTWVYTGDPSDRPTLSNMAANRTTYVRRSTPAVPISQVQYIVGVASGNICISAYAHDAATNKPGARLATTGSIPCPATGPRTAALGATVTPEWLSIGVDNNTATFSTLGGGTVDLFTGGAGRVAIQDTAFPSPDPANILSFVTGGKFLLIGKP